MSVSRESVTAGSKTRNMSAVVHGGVLQRKCACGQHTGGGEQCEECKKREMTLQRQSNGAAAIGAIPPIVRDVLNTPGRPLDPEARDFMEPRFGQDFSQVRVH